MENLFSVVDLGKIGLMAERAKVAVYSTNIANANNSQYVAKDINFDKLLMEIQIAQNGSVDDLKSQFVIDEGLIIDDSLDKNVSLDQQVTLMTDAELRYQTIALAIQKKIGLLDLVVGGKNK